MKLLYSLCILLIGDELKFNLGSELYVSEAPPPHDFLQRVEMMYFTQEAHYFERAKPLIQPTCILKL